MSPRGKKKSKNVVEHRGVYRGDGGKGTVLVLSFLIPEKRRCRRKNGSQTLMNSSFSDFPHYSHHFSSSPFHSYNLSPQGTLLFTLIHSSQPFSSSLFHPYINSSISSPSPTLKSSNPSCCLSSSIASR